MGLWASSLVGLPCGYESEWVESCPPCCSALSLLPAVPGCAALPSSCFLSTVCTEPCKWAESYGDHWADEDGLQGRVGKEMERMWGHFKYLLEMESLIWACLMSEAVFLEINSKITPWKLYKIHNHKHICVCANLQEEYLLMLKPTAIPFRRFILYHKGEICFWDPHFRELVGQKPLYNL